MSNLNAKQVENLTEPGTYEDGERFRLVTKVAGAPEQPGPLIT